MSVNWTDDKKMGKMERPENRAPTQATDRSGVTSETVASKPVKEQQEPCFHRSALLLAHRGGVHGRPRSLALPRELAINVVAKNPQQLGTPGSSKRAGPSRASILKQNPAPLIVDEIDAAEETVTTSFPVLWSMSGQPSPQTLLAQISASVLVKNEGQDGEVVPGEILVHEVAPDDVMPSEVVPDEALEVAAEVMEAASSELEPTDAVETILVPDEDVEEVEFHGTVVQAVEEVQQVEDITAEVMASAGVTVDNTVLCKVEPCEKSSEIWVLGDIITVDEQAHCILAEHVAAGASSTDTEALLGGPKHACVDCGKEFTTVFHLRRHRRIHTGERPYPCKVCGQCFRHSTSLKVHMRRHTGEEPFQCTVCSKTFKDPANFKVHQNSHSKERPYACRVCEKRFNAASTLYAHMKIHTGERPYACTICNRSFTFNNTLVRHIRTHTGEKPYKCELCPLRFSTASNLSSHRKKHSQERQFHCEICPQEFSTATALASHVKTHTGEHAHQCEVCSRGFAKFAGLQAHMRKHTGERAFYCSECGKGFTRKLHLKQHVASEHEPARPVATCEVCQRDFVNVESLQVHMKTHNVSRGTSAIVVYINKK
ncbi:hypothetical protein HPB49_023603 [Dermacentor silvarum]|uniref:Uncharacterized protein n=1 Tax=Dermacentor silvarum TaxID=543639 RepID=A0ACB8DGG8_DERSI|nr:hypothetical protein HPB49_023603 [Dermacentor silvarum]